jgi:hypothetical protein
MIDFVALMILLLVIDLLFWDGVSEWNVSLDELLSVHVRED